MKLILKLGLALTLLATIALVLLFNLVQNNRRKKVTKLFLEGISFPTPTITPQPSPTPSPVPSPKPSPKPTKTPTPTPIPQPTFTSEEIQDFIARFAGQYSISPDILRHIAVCESGFDPTATNGPYAGLYQFDALTWKNNRELMGETTDIDLRFNAEEAVQTAAYLISIGKGSLWPNCFP